jgi:regulator of sigma E protease
MLLSAFAFVMVFGLVVLVHELGHFWFARKAGITVLEFGFGYPPRIKTLAVRDGVEYTLNAIPLGGFTRMLGEEDPTAPGSFASKSAWARIRTLVAGPAMNLLLAVVLFAAAAVMGQQIAVGRVLVTSVLPGSPAESAGIQAGDLITAVQGQTVRNTDELYERTQTLLGQEVSLSLLRGPDSLTVRLTPRVKPPAGEGAMGIVMTMQEGWTVATVRQPIWKAPWLGIQEAWSALLLTLSGFGQLLRGTVSPKEITGPVGIFQISGLVARTGLANLMRLTAFISINLSLFNLFPLPALDGGRIAFIVLEKLRGGRRIAPQHEGLVHLIGLLALVGLMLVVSYFDITRLLSGKTLLP